MPARRAPSMPDAMTFSFLNETRRIESPAWGADTTSQLWRYNLHYFDDLNAFDAHARYRWHITALERWIMDNPPPSGDAWAPYPMSLRIVNWIKWALSGAQLNCVAAQSLATQAQGLSKRLEYHLLGNHLFVNAKALVFAGLFFEGSTAERWLEKGMAILAREIPEQILADGGQFERSPMYHALALEDVLDLINVTNAFRESVPQKWHALVASWGPLATRMQKWLSAMCHPDGEIAFFNDAAVGVAPSPGELHRVASKLLSAVDPTDAAIDSHDASVSPSVGLTHLVESGYVRADAPHAVLLADVAAVGPDHIPGHAHADTLSFELSLFGQRVIVNGGTSEYGSGTVRESERGTRAHSTVAIDGHDSSQVWSGFRVARRARPFDLAITRDAHCTGISCAHDGYRRLPGRPVHRRTWLLEPGILRVKDRIEGRFRFAVARFHLHPSVECSVGEATTSGRLHLPGGRTVQWRAVGGHAHIERTHYAPQFGRREPTQCLAIAFAERSEVSMEITW